MVWLASLVPLLAAVASAVPLSERASDIVDQCLPPTILYPHNGATVWGRGEFHHIVWTPHCSSLVTNFIFPVFLRKDGETAVTIVDGGLDLRLERIEIVVPNYIESGSYQLLYDGSETALTIE